MSEPRELSSEALTWEDELRFWDFVQRGPITGCWPWTGSRKDGWHGEFRVSKTGPITKAPAHRIAWVIANRRERLSSSDVVAHRCDNPICCNPAHLFKTDQQGNRRDCVVKDRQAKGTANGRAVLSEAQVIEIRAAFARGLSIAAIAQPYGVDKGTIRAIVTGKTWRHVPDVALSAGGAA